MPLLKCNASKAKPKDGITYITDPKKAAYVSSRNLFEDEDFAEQFEQTAKRFGKGDKFDERKYYHFKLSCARPAIESQAKNGRKIVFFWGGVEICKL